MPAFIPGLELNCRFYWEAVRPILDRDFPGLPHAAAHIGYGSDVLGFDTEMSTDHGWGPSGSLFLREADAGLKDPIREALAQGLPHTFLGYPVDVIYSAAEPDTPLMKHKADGRVDHRVRVTSVREFLCKQLGYDLRMPFDALDWLTCSAQLLLEVTAGQVFYDSPGELGAWRARLAYYPHEVWLYLLASGWQRIGQEEHLMPRAGYVGDELGSALIGSRLVRDVMNLCFLMERRYAPYPKWFGTAFARLSCAPQLQPLLRQAQLAASWQERMTSLGQAFEGLVRMHNALHLTPRMPEAVSPFHNRPFLVIHGDAFAAAIRQEIHDPELRRIADDRLIGGIDQVSDNVDVCSKVACRAALRALYA